MQIVIKIPEKTYHMINAGLYDYGDMNVIIKNSIPIPDNATNGDIIKALFPKIDDNFSNVIDLKLWWNAKYKGTGEIQCNHTDAEIAKSFIEDVEAVKDLLPQESEVRNEID